MGTCCLKRTATGPPNDLTNLVTVQQAIGNLSGEGVSQYARERDRTEHNAPDNHAPAATAKTL